MSVAREGAVSVAREGAVSVADAEATACVESLVRRSGSSFFWAMRLLPTPRRRGLYALYAFCRELDDIADEPAPTADQRSRLDAWRREVASLYEGAPATLIGRALLEPVRRFGLPRDEFDAFIDGMDMDIDQGMRAPALDRLRLYCRRVAGAVGLLSLPVFGSGGDEARRFALELGEALQLTNILRDVAEDARMGRLYLPREILDEAGIAPPGTDTETMDVLAHPRLGLACAGLARLAEGRFIAADRTLARITDRQALRPAVMMMAVYRALFNRLRRRGFERIEPRLRLSAAETLWIALRARVLGRG
ncbi:MAG: presqualene diphosphate synthase HpnD [Alphaproteobacteria bacterium]